MELSLDLLTANLLSPVVLAFGIPESLAAGGIVIGYYFAYGWGVRRRIRTWQIRTSF